MARDSWETPVFASPTVAQAGVEEYNVSDAEPAGPDSNPETAAECFCNLLLEQLSDSSRSAETVCTLAYYAPKAGTKGFVEEVAMKPHEGGGNFQREGAVGHV